MSSKKCALQRAVASRYASSNGVDQNCLLGKYTDRLRNRKDKNPQRQWNNPLLFPAKTEKSSINQTKTKKECKKHSSDEKLVLKKKTLKRKPRSRSSKRKQYLSVIASKINRRKNKFSSKRSKSQSKKKSLPKKCKLQFHITSSSSESSLVIKGYKKSCLKRRRIIKQKLNLLQVNNELPQVTSQMCGESISSSNTNGNTKEINQMLMEEPVVLNADPEIQNNAGEVNTLTNLLTILSLYNVPKTH